METAIEIANLSFNYNGGGHGLHDISLTVPAGDSVAMVGRNGAGKSTLLMHLNGVLRSDGCVRVLGRTVDERSLKWVRSQVGLVFQDPDDQLFSPTVWEDVAFGPINMGYSAEEVHARVAQSLEWVGLSGYEQRSPHHLSLGEKKRVALATVLSMSPHILVLDEPSANLDPASKWQLIELLRTLPQTRVIASHDLELAAALCQRTIVLDRGRLVADGPTQTILSDLPLLRAHGLAPSGDGHKAGQ